MKPAERPAEHPCRCCAATVAACGNRRWLSARACCAACDHCATVARPDAGSFDTGFSKDPRARLKILRVT